MIARFKVLPLSYKIGIVVLSPVWVLTLGACYAVMYVVAFVGCCLLLANDLVFGEPD